MSDKVTWEDVQDAWEKLEKYTIPSTDWLWIFYAPIYYRFHRLWKKQMKVGCHGGGRIRHKQSRKARSRHFAYRFPIDSNDYFTGDV
jgi:hypothetical protein